MTVRDAARPAATAVVACVLAAGVATADGLLEPGRSERDGVRLAPLQAVSTGADGDWYPLGGAEVEGDSALRVRTTSGGTVLLSRPVALSVGACYRVLVQVGVISGRAAVRLLDEQGDETLLTLTPGREVVVRTTRSRVSLGIHATAGTAFAVGEASLLRAADCPEGAPVA